MANRSEKTVKHDHLFGQSGKCSCGAFKISHSEYLKMYQLWDKYYEEVKRTESYRSFIACRQAFAKGDMGTVKELAAKATQRRLRREYLPKPACVDPSAVRHSQYEDGTVIFYGEPIL